MSERGRGRRGVVREAEGDLRSALARFQGKEGELAEAVEPLDLNLAGISRSRVNAALARVLALADNENRRSDG
jgi:hypothetical protein